tara:strand:+ start:1533 stop:1925 length:393 start_codon:yes stop_codon:yes gene_type:complete
MYKINVTVEEDEEEIEGNVIFDNLEKLKHNRDLDILLSLIYKTLVHEKNNINLVKMEIFYVRKCGNYEPILTFNDPDVLFSIFAGLDYWQKLSTHQDKERLEKHYENDFKKRLKFLDLDRDLQFELHSHD